MESIADVISFCKRQAEFHLKKSGWRRSKPEAIAQHTRLYEHFKSASEFLEKLTLQQLQEEETRSPPEQRDLFAIDPFDFGDLPDELVSELSISRADQEDAQVIQLFRIAARPLNINEVMVGLYRKFKVQPKRTALSARLYRLASRGDLLNVEKGLYSLPKLIGTITTTYPSEKEESPH